MAYHVKDCAAVTRASVTLETAALPYLRRLAGDNISAGLRRATREHLTAVRILRAGGDAAETVARLRALLLPAEQPTNPEETTHGQTSE